MFLSIQRAIVDWRQKRKDAVQKTMTLPGCSIGRCSSPPQQEKVRATSSGLEPLASLLGQRQCNQLGSAVRGLRAPSNQNRIDCS